MNMYSVSLAIGLCFVFAGSSMAAPSPTYRIEDMICAKNSGFVRHPKNCSIFYQCNFGKPINFVLCPDNLVFSNSLKNCVRKDSVYNDCNQAPVITKHPKTIAERCQEGEHFIHHPSDCASYYNCSKKGSSDMDFLEECEYPKLFSLKTFKCEHFEDVQCGVRNEPKYACDYRQNQCQRAHCRPCYLRFPKCDEDLDGYVQLIPGPWRPEFVRCWKGRSFETSTCPNIRGKQFIFDPLRQQCVDDVQLSVFRNGPSCSHQVDNDYYPDDSSCAAFHFCTGGHIWFSVECKDDGVYNQVTGSCGSPNEVCKPCGTKNNCNTN